MKHFTPTQLRKRLARECEERTAESVALAIGVSSEFISMVIHGRRQLSKKVLDYLRVRRVVTVRYLASR